MADVFSKTKRSQIMSQILSKGAKATEGRLLRLLRTYRITGWRRQTNLFGKPDFVFRKNRLAIFVDGCFWHGCPEHSSQPATNRAFWIRKLSRNRDRDRLVSQRLRKSGWRVLRIWQHELTHKHEAICVKRIRLALSQSIAIMKIRKSPSQHKALI